MNTPKLDKPPLSVAEAQRRHVCRFCQIDDLPSPDNPLELNYGAEYAHQKCIEEAKRMGFTLPVTSNPEPWVVAANQLSNCPDLSMISKDLILDIIQRACLAHAATVTAQLRQELEHLRGELKDEEERHRGSLEILARYDADFAKMMDERDALRDELQKVENYLKGKIKGLA